ncbi:MAG TPA: MFS transporter [Thermoprotei archaeon]|nr:MFS transporter [Thermoprotei archaeon]
MAQREESLDSSELTASLFLAVATFAIFLSSTLVKPVLPVLAEELGGESLEIAGVLMASIVFLSLLQPFTGVLADRYGYLKAIVAGGVLGALTSLLCALASKWQELLVLRALGGLADAVSGPAILALATSISSKRRGLVLGIFRSSQGLSFVIGPILGALLARLLFLRAPFFFDSVLTFIAIVLFLLFFRRE